MPSEPVRRSLGYAFYDVVGVVLTVVGALGLPLLRLSRHRQGLEERLGRIPKKAVRRARPLWIHAASVGEVLSTEPLIKELRRHRPGMPVVVSTTSWTGRETAARLGADAVMLLPLDIRWVVRRAVRAVRPRMFVTVETELWPALLREVARSGAPIALVSGRISTAALRRYRFAGRFLRAVLGQVTLFAMQSEEDAERVRAIGAPAERVCVIGSLKFARDTAAGPPRARGARLLLPEGRPVLVAASTQPGEEEMVLDACSVVWRRHADAFLVLAPRRPERFAEIAHLLEQRRVPFVRRSERGAGVTAEHRVLLLDTLGELADSFPAARAVYVGGTMGKIGGHNVLEPAVFGRPVSFGPDTANVAASADALVAAGGATRVGDASGLAAVWVALLDDEALAQRMGQAARTVVERQAAVAARTAEALLPLLPEDHVDAESESA